MLLDGRVVNGTALNATAATGSAANGNLGPGAILVNGTTNSGTGAAFEGLTPVGWPLCRLKHWHSSSAAAAVKQARELTLNDCNPAVFMQLGDDDPHAPLQV